MARKRTLSPEFHTSDQVVQMSIPARLLFAGMWNFCDDGGVHPASTRRLKMEVYPAEAFTDAEIRGMVEEMKAAVDENGTPLLMEYEAKGKTFWYVTGWDRWQKPDKPCFRYPQPKEGGEFGDSYPNGRRAFDDSSPADTDTETETETEMVLGSPSDGSGAVGRTDSGSARGAIAELAERADWAALDWGAVVERAKELGSALRKYPNEDLKKRDVELCMKTAALERAELLPRAIVQEVLELTRTERKKTPGAWFTKCLRLRVERMGVDFARLMSAVKVPARKESV
jgi:hypothetical protein